MRLYALILSVITLSAHWNTFSQNGLNLDGVNDYVQTTYEGISGTSARSVEAWINTTVIASPTDGGVQQIITDWGTFVTGGRFTFNVLWNNAIRVEVGGSGLSGTIPVNDGEWHHVAVVYDPLAIEPYKLFVDGVLDVEGDIDTDINTVLGTDMRIGLRVDDARYFEGEIDEVRVWDFARTQDELIADMNNEYCEIPEGLVAYYKCNHGVADGSNPGVITLEDFSGADNDGTLMNFALFGTSSNWVVGVDLESIITAEIFPSACESYTVPSGDETYFETGIYMDTLTSVFGCDSILTINLTIGEILTDLIVEACELYTVPSGDETYTLTGIYSDTLMAIEGCDSIITIDLTVNYNTEFHFDTTACEMYEAPSGAIYDEPGTYLDIIANETGCDSLITIELLISEATTSTLDVEMCYAYTSPSGADYTMSGTYEDIIENEAGCDSIITINLTILEDSEATLTLEECDAYTVPSGVETYFESGIYEDIIPNEAGCDSIITIDLTILEVNTVVTVDDPVLTADEVGATYQWVDCDNDFAEIDGATDQSFVPAANGNYALVITQDGCTDTSDCYAIATVNLTSYGIPNGPSFYPNPSTGELNIVLNQNAEIVLVKVFGTDGKLQMRQRFDQQTAFQLDLPTANGLYLIHIETETELHTFYVSRL